MNGNSLLDQWLEKANDDLVMAKGALVGKKKIVWSSCFHAQQSAEKLLKAFLVSRSVEPEKVHDLIALLDACIACDREFSFLQSLCRLLNPYSVQVRYPEELGLILNDAKKAIEATVEVRSFVLRKIGEKS